MIRFINKPSSTVFKAEIDHFWALVCPVGCDGVMTDGLAAEAMSRYPDESAEYQNACRPTDIHRLRPGQLKEVWCLRPGSTIKAIWFAALSERGGDPCEMRPVMSCLQAISDAAARARLVWPRVTVLIPAMGCDNGGLVPGEVRRLMENILCHKTPRLVFRVYGIAV